MDAFPSFNGEMSDESEIFASLIEVSMETRIRFKIKYSFVTSEYLYKMYIFLENCSFLTLVYFLITIFINNNYTYCAVKQLKPTPLQFHAFALHELPKVP